jgi:hypothetical protein
MASLTTHQLKALARHGAQAQARINELRQEIASRTSVSSAVDVPAVGGDCLPCRIGVLQ